MWIRPKEPPPPTQFCSYRWFLKTRVFCKYRYRAKSRPVNHPALICVAMCSISPQHSVYTIFFSFPGHDFDTVTHYCCQIINSSERAPEKKKKTTKEKPSCKLFPLASVHHSAGETIRKRISHPDAPARIICLAAPPL